MTRFLIIGLAPAVLLVSSLQLKYISEWDWIVSILAWCLFIPAACILAFGFILSTGNRSICLSMMSLLYLCLIFRKDPIRQAIENFGFSAKLFLDQSYRRRCVKVTFIDEDGKTQTIGLCETFHRPGSSYFDSIILDTSSQLLSPYENRSYQWKRAAAQLEGGARLTNDLFPARHIAEAYYDIGDDANFTGG